MGNQPMVWVVIIGYISEQKYENGTWSTHKRRWSKSIRVHKDDVGQLYNLINASSSTMSRLVSSYESSYKTSLGIPSNFTMTDWQYA
mmetsp:Transcript_36123/g.31882  ORF Transcript_36123/g.31882 Transcript_36123/m.31882 type:complete len:87 (-) Transcript_36123:32-292(-)